MISFSHGVECDVIISTTCRAVRASYPPAHSQDELLNIRPTLFVDWKTLPRDPPPALKNLGANHLLGSVSFSPCGLMHWLSGKAST